MAGYSMSKPAYHDMVLPRLKKVQNCCLKKNIKST